MDIKDCHLDEEQIICAVAEQMELSTDEKNHLSMCSKCNREKQELQNQLFAIGHMAGEFSPSLKRNLIPLILDSAKEANRVHLWQPVFATALVAFLIILTIWWIVPGDRYKGDKMTQDITDQNIASEISIVEEQLMSGSYINSIKEVDSYVDYEFLEFIFPMEENQNSAQSKYNYWV